MRPIERQPDVMADQCRSRSMTSSAKNSWLIMKTAHGTVKCLSSAGRAGGISAVEAFYEMFINYGTDFANNLCLSNYYVPQCQRLVVREKFKSGPESVDRCRWFYQR